MRYVCAAVIALLCLLVVWQYHSYRAAIRGLLMENCSLEGVVYGRWANTYKFRCSNGRYVPWVE